jgi:hypothetical protein
MKYKKVVFYNHFNNGDIHISRTFISELCRILGDKVEFVYSHKNDPGLLSDIKKLKYDPNLLKNLTNQSLYSVSNTTLNVGTWYGINGYKYSNKANGFNFDCLYFMFQEIYGLLDLKLENISSDPFHFFPSINYKNLHPDHIKNVDSYFLKNPQPTVLICNNHAKSGQAKNFNLTPIVLKLSKLHPNRKWILTSRDKEPNFERKHHPNVLYSSEIIKKTKGSDLNETSYLSLKCDLVIGRASGAFTFSMCKDNYTNPKKTLLSFSGLSGGKNFWLGDWGVKNIKYPAKIIESKETNDAAVVNIINSHLKK